MNDFFVHYFAGPPKMFPRSEMNIVGHTIYYSQVGHFWKWMEAINYQPENQFYYVNGHIKNLFKQIFKGKIIYKNNMCSLNIF